jgi:hypothetical protein
MSTIRNYLYGSVGLVVISMSTSLTACMRSETPNDPPTARSDQMVAAARNESLGPDVCKIQSWASQAMAQATGRAQAYAEYDRVAWNLAQVRIAALLDKNPNITKEAATKEVAKALMDVYAEPAPGSCVGGNELPKP